jgi:hypothetical protein
VLRGWYVPNERGGGKEEIRERKGRKKRPMVKLIKLFINNKILVLAMYPNFLIMYNKIFLTNKIFRNSNFFIRTRPRDFDGWRWHEDVGALSELILAQ